MVCGVFGGVSYSVCVLGEGVDVGGGWVALFSVGSVDC